MREVFIERHGAGLCPGIPFTRLAGVAPLSEFFFFKLGAPALTAAVVALRPESLSVIVAVRPGLSAFGRLLFSASKRLFLFIPERLVLFGSERFLFFISKGPFFFASERLLFFIPERLVFSLPIRFARCGFVGAVPACEGLFAGLIVALPRRSLSCAVVGAIRGGAIRSLFEILSPGRRPLLKASFAATFVAAEGTMAFVVVAAPMVWRALVGPAE
jgi:hypothetical protein